jgi:hypothetical protein
VTKTVLVSKIPFGRFLLLLFAGTVSTKSQIRISQQNLAGLFLRFFEDEQLLEEAFYSAIVQKLSKM